MRLTLSQRFNLARARYELKRMRKDELEQCCISLLKTRMAQQNSIQEHLLAQGTIMELHIDASDSPEILSEHTFIELLQLQMDEPDILPQSIDDEGWEDDDDDLESVY